MGRKRRKRQRQGTRGQKAADGKVPVDQEKKRAASRHAPRRAQPATLGAPGDHHRPQRGRLTSRAQLTGSRSVYQQRHRRRLAEMEAQAGTGAATRRGSQPRLSVPAATAGSARVHHRPPPATHAAATTTAAQPRAAAGPCAALACAPHTRRRAVGRGGGAPTKYPAGRRRVWGGRGRVSARPWAPPPAARRGAFKICSPPWPPPCGAAAVGPPHPRDSEVGARPRWHLCIRSLNGLEGGADRHRRFGHDWDRAPEHTVCRCQYREAGGDGGWEPCPGLAPCLSITLSQY